MSKYPTIPYQKNGKAAKKLIVGRTYVLSGKGMATFKYIGDGKFEAVNVVINLPSAIKLGDIVQIEVKA